jgi:hypothetical protein
MDSVGRIFMRKESIQMRRDRTRKMLKYLSLICVLLLGFVMFGCEGDKGKDATSFGTVTGTVTDNFGNRVAGAQVTPGPATFGLPTVTTNQNGVYLMIIPNGNYTLTVVKSGYQPQTAQVGVLSALIVTKDFTLTANANAAVNAANVQFSDTGTGTITATAIAYDKNLQGQPVTFTMKDANGNVIPGTTVGNTATFPIQQPSSAALKAAVAEEANVRQSVYPPGHDPIADQNDFDVPNFETLDRMQVLPISQNAFEEGAKSKYKVYAQFGSSAFNTYSSAAIASVANNRLPFVPNQGIRNVAVGQPVVLQGKTQTTYNWTITGPAGSGVTALTDQATRFPSFIPDIPGVYAVTETGSGTTRTMNIYAAKYVGILNPAPDDNPLGVIDPSCSNAGCHNNTTFFNAPYQNGVQFFDTTPINGVFPLWDQSGHRKIMVKGMSEGSHYTLQGCAKCHSVGYSQYSSAIKSDGFKDVADASGFTNQTFLANAPKFFAGPAGRFDQVLRKSEVQCEACHGPNGQGGAHNSGGNPDAVNARMSVASDVCGTCHGEPLRHARFQEWRESGHGDFETAMGEGIAGVSATAPTGTGPNVSCAGCHTGQGFPLFIQQLEGTATTPPSPLRTLNAANTAALSWLRTDNVQPQTCAACHQVHNPGDENGLAGTVIILRGDYQSGGRFAGVTPLLPSGFQANGVGMGALCITCHNSRNGGVGTTATLHEDADPNFGTAPGGTLTAPGYAAPHEACQGDVLMGRNAYFFSGPEDATLAGFTKTPFKGSRSAHSFIADTCVTCHMQKTPTDPNFGYPPGVEGAGTNHTFAIVTNKNVPADQQINALCSQCHGGFEGTGVQASFDAAYRQALIAAGNAVLRLKYGSLANATTAGVSNFTFIPGRIPQVSVNGTTPVNLNTFLASAPGDTIIPALPASGFQLDLAKANWNLSLVAPKYFATQLNGSSYDNGTPILNAAGGQVQVAGDQSRAVHNPSFVFNVLSVTQARLNAL